MERAGDDVYAPGDVCRSVELVERPAMNLCPTTIYMLDDPRFPGEIRYIGQTESPGIRFTNYLNAARKYNLGLLGLKEFRQPVLKWIASLLRDGYEPRMQLFAHCDPVLADETEAKAIKVFLQHGFELFNATAGGKSSWNKGKKMSLEYRRLLTRARIYRRGIPQTPEHIAARMAGKQRAKGLREGKI